MIIMKAEATKEEIANVVKEIRKYGLKADVSRGEYRTVIGLIGDERKIDFSHFATLSGVREAMMVETPYKLISKEYSRRFEEEGERRRIRAGNITIGGDDLIFIAGPCTIEGKRQLFKIAESVKKVGAHILRGGIFKPRSSVHSFQGLGANGWEGAEEALSWLHEAGQKFEMPVITEVRGETQIDLVAKYVDIMHEGNKDIILCERGILPVGKGKNYTRYTFDLAAVTAIQKETYLPIIADPSHATGRRDLIFNMSCAAIAAGASGLMIETHYNPSEALVDAQQMITPDELKEVIDACQRIYKLVACRQKT